MTAIPENPKIEQCDRIEGAALLRIMDRPASADLVALGRGDDDPVVEALARHRTRAAEAVSQGEREASIAEEWDVYMTDAVSKAPEPLRQLGEYLAGLLDEDRWKTAERYLNAAVLATTQPTEAAIRADEREKCAKILEPYIDSYRTMARMGGDGRVHCTSVAMDIERNMRDAIRARASEGGE